MTNILDLLSKVDPEVFLEKFGVGVDSADSLIQAKTLTISKLMSILPPETIDPRLVTSLLFQQINVFRPILKIVYLAEVPGVAHGNKKKTWKKISNFEEKKYVFYPKCNNVGSLKNVSKFGLTVWFGQL